MTQASTPNAGTFPRSGSSKNTATRVGAAFLTIVAGAAIAAGVTLGGSADVTAGSESIYGNLEAIRLEKPAANQVETADLAHLGRVAGATPSDTRLMELNVIPEPKVAASQPSGPR